MTRSRPGEHSEAREHMNPAAAEAAQEAMAGRTTGRRNSRTANGTKPETNLLGRSRKEGRPKRIVHRAILLVYRRIAANAQHGAGAVAGPSKLRTLIFRLQSRGHAADRSAWQRKNISSTG